MKKTLLTLAALTSFALPALADEGCRDDGSTHVSLSAEARRVVQHDRVQATLNIDKTAKNPTEVQAFINSKMQAAKALYSKEAGVKVTTGSYNVYKQYTPEPAPKVDGTPAWTPEQREKNAYWQGNQSLTLDAADKDALLKLVGALQNQGLAVQGMNFYLSREASDKLRDDLTMEALGTIKKRAEAMAKTLGMKHIRYASINTNGQMPQPMAYRGKEMAVMAMSADASMPDPVAQGGESDVVITVSSDVKMK